MINQDASSILIVVGTDDTTDLEAQIRGSRHAWDIRVIGIHALLRLLKVKEDLEDPRVPVSTEKGATVFIEKGARHAWSKWPEPSLVGVAPGGPVLAG